MTTTGNGSTWPAWNGVRPLDWHALMDEAEAVRENHHLGLASVWMHVNRGDYRRARRALDRAVAGIRGGLITEDGPPASPAGAPARAKLAGVRPLPPPHPDCGRCRAGLGGTTDPSTT